MYEVPIESGKIREFARATHARSAAYQGPSAVIPPTFLTTAQLAWEPEDQSGLAALGFELSRLLHGEEEYIFHGPLPRAGETLTVDVSLGDRYEKTGKRGGTMRFGVIVHSYRDESGRLVAEQRTTAIETAPVEER